MTIRIDGGDISDWESFHITFARAFGFPESYGGTLGEWGDALRSIGDPASTLTSIQLLPGETLTLVIEGAEEFRRRSPEQFTALVESISSINNRSEESYSHPLVTLMFWG